jgi:putative FmdB family regulatory protein
MPIYEYRCAQCRRRFSLLVGVVAGATSESCCPRCGSRQVSKLISRFAVARSEDEMLEDIADPDRIGDIEDPRAMAGWMKKVSREMGEDLGDDFDELVEEAVREEEQGEDADPESTADAGDEL